MKRIALLAVVMLAGCASVPTKQHAVDVANGSTVASETNTAGVLVVAVDDVPQLVILVSTTGGYLELSYDDCSASEPCKAVVLAMQAKDKLQVIDIKHGDDNSST